MLEGELQMTAEPQADASISTPTSTLPGFFIQIEDPLLVNAHLRR